VRKEKEKAERRECGKMSREDHIELMRLTRELGVQASNRIMKRTIDEIKQTSRKRRRRMETLCLRFQDLYRETEEDKRMGRELSELVDQYNDLCTVAEIVLKEEEARTMRALKLQCEVLHFAGKCSDRTTGKEPGALPIFYDHDRIRQKKAHPKASSSIPARRGGRKKKLMPMQENTVAPRDEFSTKFI